MWGIRTLRQQLYRRGMGLSTPSDTYKGRRQAWCIDQAHVAPISSIFLCPRCDASQAKKKQVYRRNQVIASFDQACLPRHITPGVGLAQRVACLLHKQLASRLAPRGCSSLTLDGSRLKRSRLNRQIYSAAWPPVLS